MKKYAQYLSMVTIIFLILSLYPVLQIKAEETDTLTPSYFLSVPEKTLFYEYRYADGTTERLMSVWYKDETDFYTNSIIHNDGAYNFAKYILDDNGIAQVDSGFFVPRSEWSNDPVIIGKNVVFKNVTPAATWTNDYQTKDAWDTVCHYKSKYTFIGFENIVVMDKEVRAAKFNWHEEKEIISEPSTGVEWSHIPYTATHDEWYVNGIGLVKSNCIIENLGTDERCVTTCNLVEVRDKLEN